MLSIWENFLPKRSPMAIAEKASSSMLSAFGWTLTTILVFVSAFAIYAAFYVLYVPTPLHVKKVHFEFPTHGFNKYLGPDDVPFAVVSLRDGDADQKSEGERILARGQKYTVSLVLHVPLSEENKKVGMFMTKLTFLSKTKVKVGTVSRSALIPFSSPVVSTLSSLFDFFLLHWRWKRESEQMIVKLFESFIDDSYQPAETVFIQIYCNKLQLYSAELRIEAVFSGIRYYMFYWPLTAATLGISSNVGIGLVLALWLYLKFCRDSSNSDDEFEELFEIDDIMGAGFNTDTESTATTSVLPREGISHEQAQDPGANEESSSATHAGILRPNRGMRRFIPALRNDSSQQRVPAEVANREPPVSLTNRLRTAKITKSESCQTDISHGCRDEQPISKFRLEKVE